MSVKEYVQQPNIRPVLDSLFPKPEFDVSGDLQAQARTENYAEMGAAFNYMFTFWLAVNHDDLDIVRWPTNAGLRTIETSYPDYAETAHDRVDTAEESLATLIETGVPDADLAAAALDLARVEAAYHGDEPRALHLLRRLGEADPEDVADLLSLYELIPDEFHHYDRITVNPEFGPIEMRFGGIDADVVCDGTLLDIKTTKDLSLKINYWRKLVAYATLAETAHSINAQFDDVSITVPELTHVGLYFSRHGVLWTVPTESIYSHPKYGEFKDWLLSLVPQ